MTKRVLVIDGGGAKGIIPMVVIKEIERILGAPIYRIFDLVVGTSVGSVIGGPLCTGDVKAEEFYEEMVLCIPELFKTRIRVPFIQPRYSRKPFIDAYSKYIDPTTLMNECLTRFVCTSYGMVRDDKGPCRTHFFKSWEEKDGQMKLLTAINRSYAAPWYFGAIDDKENNQVWLDGGCGALNSPQDIAFEEIKRLGWFPHERVHMISLGCGQADYSVSYKEALRYKNVRQTFFFMNPPNGGLARLESKNIQTTNMKSTAFVAPNFTYQRIEAYDIKKELDVMDGVEYIPEYIELGYQLSQQVEYRFLR